MIHFEKKKLTVIAALAVCVFIGTAAHQPEQKQPGWKNLKVLPQNISKDSLDTIMSNFKVSLGVKCNFCHAMPKGKPGPPDFASDEKPEKEIARSMMKMTASINQTYFNFNSSNQPDTIRVVGCNTCHRGEPHPEGKGMDD